MFIIVFPPTLQKKTPHARNSSPRMMTQMAKKKKRTQSPRFNYSSNRIIRMTQGSYGTLPKGLPYHENVQYNAGGPMISTSDIALSSFFLR